MTGKLKEPVKEGSCTDWFFCQLLEKSQKARWFFEKFQKPETDSYFILKFCNITRTDFENPESEVITKSGTHPTLVHLVEDSGDYVSFLHVSLSNPHFRVADSQCFS
jgi:hypothetical protein